MHIIQLINDYRNYKNKDKMHKIKYVKDIIQDLENYGPASLIHIAILSNILKRRINIWNANGNLNKIIGRKKLGPSIDIEYHANNSEQIGHWTLRGSKDPDNVTIDLNSCLFSVIGSQIGQDPLKLRKWTVLKLENDSQSLAKWLDKIQWKGSAGVFLMIGGVNGHGPESPRTKSEEVRYSKRYPAHSQKEDARQLLEDSENIEGEGDVGDDKHDLIGHSREQHVVGGRNGGVATYTRINKCAATYAFQSEQDQDYALHRALLSKSGQEALHKLDNSIKSDANIPVSELKEQDVPFPKGSYWYVGNMEKTITCFKGYRLYRDYIQKLTKQKFVLSSTFEKLKEILTEDGYSIRYPSSNTIENAKQILDNSEGKSCEDDPRNPKTEDFRTGHARSRHVVKRSNGVNGVEAYTRTHRCETKSAFQSEEEQNYILHRALLSAEGQVGLVLLNLRFYSEIGVKASRLSESNGSFPKGSNWHNGKKINDEEIEMVHIYLGHQKGESKNNSAEPFVINMFPRLKNKTKKGKKQKEQEGAQAAPETASATTSKPVSKTPPKRATGATPKIRKTAPKTASPTTSKPASKTSKTALKTATGTIRKTGHVTTPETVHKITPTTSHKPTPKSTRKSTSKITRKTAP
ncbi:uncharacterized protein LOC118646211 isoform X2 [Monomorium pharaonis]|uniref:uncharacterized protein LOC118646211 isoform X2 n=1 Tax=Monomorium pharaonis TaxID=307658 RepID=UPI0017465D1E|nr:uncharacterized protein LOC118646211 isoform X2 [Monomorium pharaonis]